MTGRTETAPAGGGARPGTIVQRASSRQPREDAAPARPPLLPAAGWARVALLLLLLFTLGRGLLWADFVPAFWGPDEDYHFRYAEHIVTQGSLPDPDKPLYPDEYSVTVDAIQYNAYGSGGRTSFDGDPHA